MTTRGNQVAALRSPASFADHLGLDAVIADASARTTERTLLHDRGKIMVHRPLLLVGSAESFADIKHLRARRLLFPDGGSDLTLYRGGRQVSQGDLAAVEAAGAQTRGPVCHRLPSV